MEIANKDLKRRLIEISYRKKLSHLGSVLTAVDIIKEIYDKKKKEEKFVLSSGHAGLALYVVNEAMGGVSAEESYDHHGVHPDRCVACGIDCSSGSLGHGIGIAVGMALADCSKDVYVLLSDGEMSEGSVWEALRVMGEQRLKNIHIYFNFNDYAAYKFVDKDVLTSVIEDYVPFLGNLNFHWTSFEPYKIFDGQDAHYISLDAKKYKKIMEVLK